MPAAMICAAGTGLAGAAVIVSVVHVEKGSTTSTCVLDGRPVVKITAFLFHRGGHESPTGLVANAGKSFQGTIVLGKGFTFDDRTPDATPLVEMKRLIEKEPINGSRIFPYIGGREVNSSPTHAHHRFVINFEEMSEREARRWPDLMKIVEGRVKPERMRQKNNSDGRRRKKYWWQFGRYTPALFAALAEREHVLVASLVSKHLSFALLPSSMVFSHKLVVFPEDGMSFFCGLQARPHEIWAWFLSSTMKDDLNYSPSDCFETFPFPPDAALASLDAIGRELYDARARYMVDTNQGLTATYNQLKDPTCADEPQDRIRELRRLHEDLDRGVLAAYGWSDIAVPPYCPALNAERAAEEAAAAGLPAATRSARGTRTATPKKKGGRKAANQTSLLDED